MKKFGILLVLCSLGMFTIGCDNKPTAPGGGTGHTGATGNTGSTGSTGSSSASTK